MAEEEAHKRLIFFTPDGKWLWKVMPMRSLNAAQTLLSMTTKIQMECYTLTKECGLKNVVSKIIFDDVLLYGQT